MSPRLPKNSWSHRIKSAIRLTALAIRLGNNLQTLWVLMKPLVKALIAFLGG